MKPVRVATIDRRQKSSIGPSFRRGPIVELPRWRGRIFALVVTVALVTGVQSAAESGQGGILDAPMRGVAEADAAAAGPVRGKVVETMNSGGYTYVQVDADGKKVWAAGPTTRVGVGETVSFERGMLMHDYHSKSLDKTFEEIYFVGRIATDADTASSGAPSAERRAAHGGIGSAEGIEVTGIAKLNGGKTVAELYQEKGTLVGREVAVRGKVVKVNLSIMGKNWLHVRDGSSTADGNNDLTVTTAATVGLGDVVVVRGKLATDRDFGFGYHYDVMIEDAAVTVE